MYNVDYYIMHRAINKEAARIWSLTKVLEAIYGRDTYSSIVLENIRENTAQKIQILKRAQSDYS